MVGITVFFRYHAVSDQGVRPHTSIEDGKSAVRWVRQNAEMLGIDPDRVVVAHGEVIRENGEAFLRRAFSWLL